MDIKLVDATTMKTLEEYMIALALGIFTLVTAEKYHIEAIRKGLLKEDQEMRAQSILWDLVRLKKSYKDQLESVEELVPEGLDISSIIKLLQKTHEKKEKQLKKKKVDGGNSDSKETIYP